MYEYLSFTENYKISISHGFHAFLRIGNIAQIAFQIFVIKELPSQTLHICNQPTIKLQSCLNSLSHNKYELRYDGTVDLMVHTTAVGDGSDK
jgi:hypothetical protein